MKESMKLAIILITIIAILAQGACAFASSSGAHNARFSNAKSSHPKVELRNVTTHTIKPIFNIKSGKAICACKLITKSHRGIKTSKASVKIINSNGITVKKYTTKMIKFKNIFYFEEKFALGQRGTSYMKITITCFNKNKKVKAITKTTASKVY